MKPEKRSEFDQVTRSGVPFPRSPYHGPSGFAGVNAPSSFRTSKLHVDGGAEEPSEVRPCVMVTGRCTRPFG